MDHYARLTPSLLLDFSHSLAVSFSSSACLETSAKSASGHTVLTKDNRVGTYSLHAGGWMVKKTGIRNEVAILDSRG